jgi:hypothetical protein
MINIPDIDRVKSAPYKPLIDTRARNDNTGRPRFSLVLVLSGLLLILVILGVM